MEGLTPEEAREIPLPRNPFKRHQEVLGHLSDMGLAIDGWGEPTVGLLGGRAALVRAAEAGQEAEEMMGIIQGLGAGNPIEGPEVVENAGTYRQGEENRGFPRTIDQKGVNDGEDF